MTRPGIEPRSPGPLANTLTAAYESLITFFNFRFSTWGKRDTIFLCWLFVHRQLSTHWLNKRAAHVVDPNRSRLGELRKSTRPVWVQNSTLFFFQISKSSAHRFRAWCHSHPQLHFSIWGFYFDICDCLILPARAWTRALMSTSTHALSRKVLSQTKPKGKIYKTKNDDIKKILPQLYKTSIPLAMNNPRSLISR